MKSATKPLPVVDLDSRPFWEGCAHEELLLQQCAECGAYRHPPSPICRRCLSPRHEWVAATGHGRVYSFVVVHHPFDPAWESDLPYVVVVIELAEGPLILSNVVHVSPEQVSVGMPVRVCYERASEEIVLPVFCPAEG